MSEDESGFALHSLERQLAESGLAVFGRFAVHSEDISDSAHSGFAGRSALLIGNAGGGMWQAFSTADEFGDGASDPLDRWTQRVVSAAIGEQDAALKALFPFGDPVWPFQRWAKRATAAQSSPLGLLIHPEYGLWWGLRAAVILLEGADEKQIQDVERAIHPCDDCAERPCLSACPVNAFTSGGFAVYRCRSWLDSIASQSDSGGERADPDCLMTGCAARNACPVGREWRQPQEQIRFHLRAFAG